jgi:hypothetical protein
VPARVWLFTPLPTGITEITSTIPRACPKRESPIRSCGFRLFFFGRVSIFVLLRQGCVAAKNKAIHCTDWVDVGLSAASGALFGGALGNAGKAAKGLKDISDMRKITPTYVSPLKKPGIINDTIKETAKSGGKGVAATAVGLGKGAAGLPQDKSGKGNCD